MLMPLYLNVNKIEYTVHGLSVSIILMKTVDINIYQVIALLSDKNFDR